MLFVDFDFAADVGATIVQRCFFSYPSDKARIRVTGLRWRGFGGNARTGAGDG